MMRREYWLRIGAENTGTTSVQEFLARNRGKMLDHGYLYPKSPGATNQCDFDCYAQDDGGLDSVRGTFRTCRAASIGRYRTKPITPVSGPGGIQR
jgi:hypothetical protein